MSLATSLRTAARNLITTFGNSAILHSYGNATKVIDEEGDVTISGWSGIASSRNLLSTATSAITLTAKQVGIIGDSIYVTVTTVGSNRTVVIDYGVITETYTNIASNTLIVDAINASSTLVTATLNSALLISNLSRTNLTGGSDAGTGTTFLEVDGNNAKEILSRVNQGIESLGKDEIIIRDDVTVMTNDRVVKDGVNYRIVQINPIRTQSTLVVQMVSLTRVEDLTNW